MHVDDQTRPLIVALRTSSSVSFLTFQMRFWPCQPLNGPMWQSLQSGMHRYCECCTTWCASLGPSALHTPQGISLMRARYRRSGAVGRLSKVHPQLDRCCVDEFEEVAEPLLAHPAGLEP